MLHDQRLDREPSLPGFALFVVGKPRDQRYDWLNFSVCPVTQYLASINSKNDVEKWGDGPLKAMNSLARGGHKLGAPRRDQWTFGQLSDRILAHQRAETVEAALP